MHETLRAHAVQVPHGYLYTQASMQEERGGRMAEHGQHGNMESCVLHENVEPWPFLSAPGTW